MPRVKLTAKGVEHLRADGAAPTEYWDAYTPGLSLRVGARARTWYVRYRVNGTHRRHKLGSYPRLSLADARDAAKDILSKVDAGSDPAAEKARRRTGERTMRALVSEVLAAKKVHTRPVTHAEYERLIKRDILPVWGDREAGSITRREVVQLIEAVARRAPVTANRLLDAINIVFNAGLRRDFPDLESNPAHLVVPPAPETPRDRYLTRDELKAVWRATEGENPITRAIFRLAFLTAQRVGSVLRMQWSLIDGDVWTIPAIHFKGGREHRVPLSAEAQAIVEAMRDPAPVDERWVFPSRAEAKAPHITNIGKASTRIRKRAGIPHWTIHDARATFRTWAVRAVEDGGLGIAPVVADSVLGHKDHSIGFTAYQGEKANYLLREKRNALVQWGAFVRAAVEAR